MLGVSSSMGKLITSVGPSSPIHRRCSSDMVGTSTTDTVTSALGWMSISRSTNVATSARDSSLTPS